jgi:serine protease inhibitor
MESHRAWHRVTHPFVYLIQEASSGAVFFIGTYQGE